LPVGKNSLGVGAQVVLAGVEAREFEVAGRVGVRRVRMEAVGSLNRHAGVDDWIALRIEDASRHGSESVRKLSADRFGKSQRQEQSENRNGSFHGAPRAASEDDFTSATDFSGARWCAVVIEKGLLFEGTGEKWERKFTVDS